MKGSIDSIESFGLVDGPGIRAVVFLNSCRMRCRYCHNPEMWLQKAANTTAEELVKKLKRFKPYYKSNSGGVTFSGGDPVMQADFVRECFRLLKEEGIHTALDTAGSGVGKYEEILEYTDLVIFDVKHADPVKYKDLVGVDIKESEDFIEVANKMNKVFWIRQVIIPGWTDSPEYLYELKDYLKRFDQIEKIEFLPYHTMATDKYTKLGIEYSFKDVPEMDKEKCKELEEKFIEMMKS